MHPSWGPSTQIRALGAGQGGQPRGPRCGPSLDLGWHPERDTEPGGWGHRQGLPGLGSQGGSPCEAQVWGLLLTPQGPGARWDSKKIQQSVEEVRWRGRQSHARGPVVASGLRAEAVPQPWGPLPSCEGQFNPTGLCPPGLPTLSLGGRCGPCGMGSAGDGPGGQPESAAPPLGSPLNGGRGLADGGLRSRDRG